MKRTCLWIALALLALPMLARASGTGIIPFTGRQFLADPATSAVKINKQYNVLTTGDYTTVCELTANGDRCYVDIPYSPYAVAAGPSQTDVYFTSDETDITKRACLLIQACALVTNQEILCPEINTALGGTTCEGGLTQSATCSIRPLLSGGDSTFYYFAQTLATQEIVSSATQQTCGASECLGSTIRIIFQDNRSISGTCSNNNLYLNRGNFRYPD